MGNIISTFRTTVRAAWWYGLGGNAIAMDTSEDISRNQTAPNERDVNKNESARDAESDSDIMGSASKKLSPAKTKELEEFRQQLAVKREARRKIIEKKSDEMQGLRSQLERERRSREETEAENNALRALLARNNIQTDEYGRNEETVNPGVGQACQNNDSSEAGQSCERLLDLSNKESLNDVDIAHLESQIEQLRDQNRSIRTELCECNMSLQTVNAEVALQNKENFELKNQIKALKEVKKVSKEMLAIREMQLTQLKEKLSEIEQSLADREMRTMSNELKQEYERQLENIRNLRILYEERSRLAEVTRINLIRELDEQKSLLESQIKKNGELEKRVEELEKEISDKDDTLVAQESQLGICKAETRELQSEMTVINQLFSQLLLGYNGQPNVDLDKLVSRLEENHALLSAVAEGEDCRETASALPRLLLDLLSQADAHQHQGEDKSATDDEDGEGSEASKTLTSAKEIVGNLPKVWRVLMELLSHQSGPQKVPEILDKSANPCYKSVQTPSGPRLVPSVSKTYIRLKDLILEKKSLQKEMTRLKQLNGHLENRLQDQERRLGLVSSELSKTWHVVGKMQRQHQQLHTHEKILRYELQQKRKLLTQLKEELEYCKEKWDKAKQKNSESQIEWDKLRLEFASRKIKSTDSINNSAESGYSDGKASDEDSDASDNEKKSDKRRMKKKGKSPELNDKLNCITATQIMVNDELVDSDALREDEDIPNDNTSDVDIQENLADSEDVSIQETDSSIAEKESVAESESTPEPSSSSPVAQNATCYNDIISTRSARLKKLEEQCYVLVNKVTKTNSKGVALCTRLEELHNQYGGGGTDQPSTSQQNVDTISRDAVMENIENVVENNNQNGAIIPLDEIVNVEDIIESDNDINTSRETEVKTPDATDTNPPTQSNRFISEYEARFAARDERLKRMEEQAKSLVKRVSNTSTRSVRINSKLDQLHNTYGKSEEDAGSSNAEQQLDIEIQPTTSSDQNMDMSNESPQGNVVENIDQSDISEIEIFPTTVASQLGDESNSIDQNLSDETIE